MHVRTLTLWLLLCNGLSAAQYVVVVVDDSGSMAEPMGRDEIRKINAAKQALHVVLDRVPSDAEVGVLALNRGWIIPLQMLDRTQIAQRVNSLRARGGTPLGERMKQGADELLKKRSERVYGDYRLIVVTDGEANDQAVLDRALPDIMSRGLLVDVIGVNMQSEHSLATQVHSYRRADDPSSLEAAISNALAETDSTDDVGGDSDFALLAGLPAEMAPSIISTLTTTNNAPIGGADLKHGDQPVYQPPTGRPRSNSGGGGFGFAAFVCMGVVFFFVATVSAIFRTLTRPNRR